MQEEEFQGTLPGACQELCHVAYHIGCAATSKSNSPPRDTDSVFVFILAQNSILGWGGSCYLRGRTVLNSTSLCNSLET